MDPTATRPLGRTGVQVTQLGLGGASYGSLFYEVPEADAIAAVGAAWDAGIRYFDTAPWYGRGLSELRTGAGLRYRPRDEYILSTKLGRWLKAQVRGSNTDLSPWKAPTPFDVVFDYTYDGIMRAYEQSQLRLGLPWYDVGVIHDLDFMYHGDGATWAAYFAQLVGSGWRAVSELKASGLLKAIGAGVNHTGLIPRYLDTVDMDFFLIAMPYTLLRQEMLDAEFPACVERGIGFVIGAPFQSGILATGSKGAAMSDYAPPSPETLDDDRAHRGGLRAPRRATGCGLAPVRHGPPERGVGHPGRPLCRARRAQRRELPPPHPGRLLGRAQGRGTAPRGCAGPDVSAASPGRCRRPTSSGRGCSAAGC